MQQFYDKVASLDFAVGLFGNFIFWVLDITLIVILLPAVLNFLENRKWSSARYAASLLVANLLRETTDKVALYLDTLSNFDTSLHRDAEDMNRRLVSELQSHLGRISQEFYNQFPIVSSAVNPDMSIQIAAIIKYNARFGRFGSAFAELTNRIHAKGTFVGRQRAPSTLLEELLGTAGGEQAGRKIQAHIVKLFDKAHRPEASTIAQAVQLNVDRIVGASALIASSVAEADRKKGTLTDKATT